MPVKLVSEADLRSALQPFRVAPDAFEAAVLARIAAAPRPEGNDPLVALPQWLRSVAALLPLPLLFGCKVTPSASKLTSASVGGKLLGYLVYPVIALFVLLSAALLSVRKIRDLQSTSTLLETPEDLQREWIQEWWKSHQWGAYALFAVMLALAYFGLSSLLFLFYVFSFGVLVFVLTAFANAGLGSRIVVAKTCMLGLMFLGQTAMFSGVGNESIHFVDQALVAAVFYSGAIFMLLIGVTFAPATDTGITWVPRIASCLFFVIVLPLVGSILMSTFWPITPSQMKSYVESFDHARFSSASWSQWEVPASWAIQSRWDLNMTKPRALLAKELAGEQNEFILSCAARTGLLTVEQAIPLKMYATRRKVLATVHPGVKQAFPFTIFAEDWVIRTAMQNDNLTPEELNIIEQRLHATLQYSLTAPKFPRLEDALRATQLLKVIGRPVRPEQYRAQVHDLMLRLHTKESGGFQLAGGFKTYLDGATPQMFGLPGDPITTAYAIELMETYGIPEGLELNWVRSFLKPRSSNVTEEKWIAAAALDRLNHLPGVTQPTWLDYVYYERTLLAAIVLVGLCLFATLTSPYSKTV